MRRRVEERCHGPTPESTRLRRALAQPAPRIVAAVHDLRNRVGKRRRPMIGNKTFDELVARSGLSPMFASHVIAHAIMREQALPAQLGPEELIRIVPALERAIRAFLRPDEGDRVMASLHNWIAGLFHASRTLVDPRSASSTRP